MVSASSRPTGYRRCGDLTSATTVGRPCGSLAVETHAARLVDGVDDEFLRCGADGRTVNRDTTLGVDVAGGIGDRLPSDRDTAVHG